MLCPHCQNSDPSMFEVEEVPGRLGAEVAAPSVLVTVFCKVCSKTFVSVAPKGKV